MKNFDFSRRDFLRMGGMSAGALIATSALPSFAEDDSLFLGRGRWERLSLTCQHVQAGASEPFSILHISDTHLTAAYDHESEWTRNFMARRTRTFGGQQENALKNSLSWAKKHVDYVVHTGDLIDAQSEANFDLVRKYFGEASGMMFGCLGNHEYYHGQPKNKEVEAGKKETAAKLSAAFPFDISIQSNVVKGVNFIALDNVYGTITASQATKFAEEVKKGLPIVLCMHCPIDAINVRRAGSKFWRRTNLKAFPNMQRFTPGFKDSTTKDFVAYLKAQPLLKAILVGHAHITVADRFSPTAMQYCVGGNFLFHGQEITFS